MSAVATLELFETQPQPAASSMSPPPGPDIVAFDVPGRPVPKGRPRAMNRFGKGGKTYTALLTPDATIDFENRVRFAAHKAMAGRAVFECAVSVIIGIYVEPPASWSDRKRNAAVARIPYAAKRDDEPVLLHPTGKPDADNVAKSALDACNGVVFTDDSQACRLLVFKTFRVTPGLSMEIAPL